MVNLDGRIAKSTSLAGSVLNIAGLKEIKTARYKWIGNVGRGLPWGGS
jgi:hypothetical protein